MGRYLVLGTWYLVAYCCYCLKVPYHQFYHSTTPSPRSLAPAPPPPYFSGFEREKTGVKPTVFSQGFIFTGYPGNLHTERSGDFANETHRAGYPSLRCQCLPFSARCDRRIYPWTVGRAGLSSLFFFSFSFFLFALVPSCHVSGVNFYMTRFLVVACFALKNKHLIKRSRSSARNIKRIEKMEHLVIAHIHF